MCRNRNVAARQHALGHATARWAVAALLLWPWSVQASEPLDQARALHAQGLYQRAGEALEALLTQAPTGETLLEAQALLGQVYFEAGELELALPLLEAASNSATHAGRQAARRAAIAQRPEIQLRTWPRSYEAEGLLQRAQQSFDTGQVTRGFDLLDETLRVNANLLLPGPGATAIGSARGVRRQLEQQPGDTYRRWLADQGVIPENIEGEEDLRQALLRHPHPTLLAAWWLRLGDHHADQGRLALARGIWQRARQSGADEAEVARRLDTLPANNSVNPPDWELPAKAIIALATPPARLTHGADRGIVRTQHAPAPVAFSPDGALAYLSDRTQLFAVRTSDGAPVFRHDGGERANPARITEEEHERWYVPDDREQEWICADGLLLGRLEDGERRNEIICLDAQSGALRWRGRDVAQLRRARVAGGPVYRNGVAVVVLVEPAAVQQLTVAGLDAQDGRVLWRTPVVAAGGHVNQVGRGRIDAYRDAPALAVDDAHVYYCSHVGGVACLDLHLGTLEWLYRYDGVLRAGPRGHGPLPFFERWTSPPLLTDSELIVQPRDSNRVIVLSKTSGVPLLNMLDLDLRAVLGADSERVYITRDRRTVAAYPLSASAPLWEWQADADLISRGALIDGAVWVRTREQPTQAVLLDPAGGNEIARRDLSPLFRRLVGGGDPHAHAEVAPPFVAHDTTSLPHWEPVWAMRQGYRRVEVLTFDDRPLLLTETGTRLTCRDLTTGALLWSRAVTLSGLAHVACGPHVLRLEADGITAIDPMQGHIAWSVKGEYRQLTTDGARWFAAHRRGLQSGDTHGASGWAFQAAPGEEIVSAAVHDSEVLLLTNPPARLIRLDASNGQVLDDLPLRYPDGLGGTAVIARAQLAQAQLDTPFTVGEHRLRWVTCNPLRMDVRDEGAYITLQEGMLRVAHHPQDDTTWWSWPDGERPRMDFELNTDGSSPLLICPLVQSRDWRLMALGHNGGDIRPVLLPVGVFQDTYFVVERPRGGMTIDAHDLATHERVWQSEMLEGYEGAHHFVMRQGRLIFIARRMFSDDLTLIAMDPANGEVLSEQPITLRDERTRLHLVGDGMLSHGPHGLTWYMPQARETARPNLDYRGTWHEVRGLVWKSARQRTYSHVLLDDPILLEPADPLREVMLDGEAGEWPRPATLRLGEAAGWLPHTPTQRVETGTAPGTAAAARVHTHTNHERLYLCVVVDDAQHHPSHTDSLIAGDCLELWLDEDPDDPRLRDNQPLLHLRLALRDGLPVLQRLGGRMTLDNVPDHAPWPWQPALLGPSAALGADNDTRLADDGALVRARRRLPCAVARDERLGQTIYEVGLPLAWLPQGANTQRLRAALTVHVANADGPQGRLAWVADHTPDVKGRLWLTQHPRKETEEP